jgi:HD-like signal output (HDOD) protein
MVGAYLLGVWGLPFVIAETVAFHDIPSSVSEGNLELLAAVHLADGVVNAAFAGRDPLAAGDLDAPFLNKVGLLVAVPKWHEKAVAGLASRVGGG